MPQCELCGSEMVLRTASRGQRRGSQFYGCSNYPRCRFTKDFSSDVPAGSDIVTDNTIYDDEFLQAEYINLRARPVKPGYQSSFFDSLALSDSMLESLYVEDANLSSIKHYSKWRVDYPINSVNEISDDISFIMSVAQKILMRGTITICSEFAEQTYRTLFKTKSITPLPPWMYGTMCMSNNQTSYQFDGEGTERKFYDKFLPKHMGPYYRNHIIPQVFIEELLTNQADNLNGSQIRSDFLITTPTESIIVEIDGKDHDAHEQRDDDRSAQLRDHGYVFIRITNDEVENESGASIEQLIDLVSTSRIDIQHDYDFNDKYQLALKTHHQLQIALTELFYAGILDIQKNKKIMVEPISNVFTRDEFRNILDTVHDDFCELIDNLFTLYNIDCSFSFELKQTNANTNNSIPTISFGETTKNQANIIIQDLFLRSQLAYPMKLNKARKVDNPSKSNLEYFLSLIFRKKSFWEGQLEAIQRAFAGKDAIVLLPTGSGKSIAFQLVSLLMPGVTIVIDPIIALIHDQIDNLRRYGIDRVSGITSDIIDISTKNRIINLFSKGAFMLTYIAPERFQTTSFREALRTLTVAQPISLIVIDEAHCVSEWGHDFRTAYLNIGRISRDYCASDRTPPPLLALTGTASNSVLRDVQRELQITDYDSIITPSTFDRKELEFSVKIISSSEKIYALKGFLHSYLPQRFRISERSFHLANGSNTACGLVFCPHVNGQFGVVQTSSYINQDIGIKTEYYAGTVPKGWNQRAWRKHKQKIASAFKNNSFPLLVATKSFGMGIDKPNIRYTIHLGLPNSIESFYQEAGRAGRDKRAARCIVLVSNDNKSRTTRLLDVNVSSEEIDRIMNEERSWENDDDITRAIYFHVNAFRGIENEANDIKQVLSLLNYGNKAKTVNITSRKMSRGNTEKALHRLLLLGVVRDYTIDYANNEFCVLLNEYGTDRIVENYAKYVSGYNKGRVLLEVEKIESIQDKNSTVYIQEACKILLEFIYDTIEKGRRRALREMLAAAEESAVNDNPDEVLRRRILRYLESSYYDEIEAIVNSSSIGFNELVSLCDGKETDTGEIVGGIRSPKDAMQLVGQTARYLESYPDHPSLLYLRAISEVYSSDPNYDIIRESILAAANFSYSRYGQSLDEIYGHLSWVLAAVMARSWEMYLQLYDILKQKYNDKKFLRILLRTDVSDKDLLYEPAMHLFKMLSDEAIQIVEN